MLENILRKVLEYGFYFIDRPYLIVYMITMFTLGYFLIYLLPNTFVFKRILAIFVIATQLVYVIWRLGYTLVFSSFADGVVSVSLFVTELLGIILGIIFFWTITTPPNDVYYRTAPEPLEGQYPTKDASLPRVDVFIPTVNEPLDILERTVSMASFLDYPRDKLNIYVLDDGHRSEVAELAQTLGVHYLNRPDKKDAKAGNLNYALSQTDGDLIAILDADMVPQQSFLKETVGFFKDPSVAFVQTPQSFFNPDPYQANLMFFERLPGDQAFFMLDVQRSRAMYNATMFVGTNALFSRNALISIGGFATQSLTEDLLTGMQLQAHGYTTIFYEKILVQGLAPQSYKDLIQQRDRWCRGNVQSFKVANPLTLKGLSWMQRILYTQSTLYWTYGIQKMMFLLAPLLFLYAHIYPVRATLESLTLFWLPQFTLSYAAFRKLTDGRRSFIASHLYEVSLAPWMALSFIKEWLGIRSKKKKSTFTVTPKEQQHVSPHVFIEGALLFSFLTFLAIGGLIKATSDYIMHQVESSALIMNVFWVLFNLIALIYSIFLSVERPSRRKGERHLYFPLNLSIVNGKGTIHADAFRLMDISETGARFLCYDRSNRCALHHHSLVKINIQEQNGTIYRLHTRIVEAKPTHRKVKHPILAVSRSSKIFVVRIQWERATLFERQALYRLIYNAPLPLARDRIVEQSHWFIHLFYLISFYLLNLSLKSRLLKLFKIKRTPTRSPSDISNKLSIEQKKTEQIRSVDKDASL